VAIWLILALFVGLVVLVVVLVVAGAARLERERRELQQARAERDRLRAVLTIAAAHFDARVVSQRRRAELAERQAEAED
jgi:predicted MPP superfamily phosphohydrolase